MGHKWTRVIRNDFWTLEIMGHEFKTKLISRVEGFPPASLICTYTVMDLHSKQDCDLAKSTEKKEGQGSCSYMEMSVYNDGLRILRWARREL